MLNFSKTSVMVISNLRLCSSTPCFGWAGRPRAPCGSAAEVAGKEQTRISGTFQMGTAGTFD